MPFALRGRAQLTMRMYAAPAALNARVPLSRDMRRLLSATKGSGSSAFWRQRRGGGNFIFFCELRVFRQCEIQQRAQAPRQYPHRVAGRLRTAPPAIFHNRREIEIFTGSCEGQKTLGPPALANRRNSGGRFIFRALRASRGLRGGPYNHDGLTPLANQSAR